MLPIVFDRTKESNFRFLFAVILLLFLIFAGGIHIGFDFPELVRICLDGFELCIRSAVKRPIILAFRTMQSQKVGITTIHRSNSNFFFAYKSKYLI